MPSLLVSGLRGLAHPSREYIKVKVLKNAWLTSERTWAGTWPRWGSISRLTASNCARGKSQTFFKFRNPFQLKLTDDAMIKETPFPGVSCNFSYTVHGYARCGSSVFGRRQKNLKLHITLCIVEWCIHFKNITVGTIMHISLSTQIAERQGTAMY